MVFFNAACHADPGAERKYAGLKNVKMFHIFCYYVHIILSIHHTCFLYHEMSISYTWISLWNMFTCFCCGWFSGLFLHGVDCNTTKISIFTYLFMRFKFVFCSKWMKTIEIIKITIMFWHYSCKIVPFFSISK